MTTFQDPQPQSRRAVRQSERGEPTPPPAAFPSSAEMWDTTARRAAQLPPATQRPDAPAAATGRRAAPAASAPPAAPEPLMYSTQGNPSAPTPAAPEVPQFRTRGAAAEPALTEAILTDQSYRVRDFSPEGRRSAAAQQPIRETAIEPPPSDLDYQTEARLHYEVPVAPISEVPRTIAQAPQVAPVFSSPIDLLPPSAPGVPIEQTLTRRELRALQQAESAATSFAEPAVEPDKIAAAPAYIAPGLAAPAYVAPGPAAPACVAPGPAAPAPTAPPAPVGFPSAPEPVANTGLTNALSEFDTLTHGAPESGVWTPPVGHWSVQADLDADDEYENTINRTVGSGTATTSALVLPGAPAGSDIRGPLTGTGEIMLTGSIDLPHSLSSTGATARFDHEGIDALFDAGDAEVISTDSAPVRAVTAVSTHNSGQGVIHTQKPKGTRALTALLIAASSMAVVVAGLLIVAFALNVF